MLTPEQQAERLKGIGASEVAAVCGFGWDKPIDIYAVKRGLIGPKVETEPMRHGNGLEPYIVSCFESETKAKILTVAEYCQTREANEHFSGAELAYALKFGMLTTPVTAPVFASPDRIARFADGLCAVEAKNVGAPMGFKWGPTGGDKFPTEYYIQVQAQLAVTRLNVGFLCALIGGNDFRWYRIERDNDTIRMLIDRCKTFWDNHVLPGIPPGEINDSAAWKAVLKDRFPAAGKNKKSVVTVPDDDPDMMEAVDAARSMKALKVRLETAKNRLQERIGDGYKIENATLSAVLVASDKPTVSTDWKAACKEANVPADIIARHTKTGEPKASYVKLTVEWDEDE